MTLTKNTCAILSPFDDRTSGPVTDRPSAVQWKTAKETETGDITGIRGAGFVTSFVPHVRATFIPPFFGCYKIDRVQLRTLYNHHHSIEEVLEEI